MASGNIYGTQLPDINDNARVMGGEPAGGAGIGTALDSLSKGLSSLANHWDTSAQRKRQEAAAARAAQDQAWQAEDRANKVTSEAVASDVTVGLNLINSNQLGDSFASDSAVAVPSDPRIEADVSKAAGQIKTTEAAVDQGRLPPLSRQAQVDLLFNRLLVKYPNKAHEIAAQFDKLGVASALFDELKGEVAAQTDRQKSDREWTTKMLNTGRENLDPKVASTMSDQEIIDFGIKYTRNENIQQDLARQAQTQSALNADRRAEVGFDQSQINDQWGIAVNNQVLTVVNPIAQKMQKLLIAIGKPGADPQLEQDYAELLTLAKTAANNIINTQIAKGGYTNQAAADAARRSLTEQVNAVLIAPFEERNKDFSAAADVFNKRMGFDFTVTAPVLNQLKQFGVRASDIPGIVESLSQDTVNGLKRELAGIGKPGINQNSATIHMMNVVSVFKGEKNLSSIDTPQERQQTVAASWQYVLKNGSAVAAGQGNGDGWMNMARQLVIASDGFNANTPPQTLGTATQAMFNTNTINAVNKLKGMSNHSAEADDLSHGLRASAAVTLAAARRAIRGQNKDEVSSPYRIMMDGEGKYQIVDNPKWRGFGQASRGGIAGGSAMMIGGGGGGTARPNIPGEMRLLVNTANQAANFLVATGKWDSDAPKGSAAEVRRFWMNDEPTSTMKTEAKKAREEGDPRALARALRRDLLDAPNRLETPPSGNSDIIGPEGTGKNPRSSAEGVGQFTKSTWKAVLQKHAPQLIENKSDEDIFSMRQNKELARRAVGWLRSDNAASLAAAGVPATRETTALAHFAGAEGAAALLKSNPNAPVESVLGRKAVAANPHLRGMTVEQAINWARRFYRG